MSAGSARLHASMGIGTMHLPLPSILSASAGTGMEERGPTARMRSSAVMTIELLSGGPPAPSIRIAPRKALLWLSGAGAHPASRNIAPNRTRRTGIGTTIIAERFANKESTIFPVMTPEAVQSPEPAPAHMSAFSRIAGVFFEPGKTFADIAAKPTWFLPLLLIVIATMAFSITFGNMSAVNPSFDNSSTTVPAARK